MPLQLKLTNDSRWQYRNDVRVSRNFDVREFGERSTRIGRAPCSASRLEYQCPSTGTREVGRSYQPVVSTADNDRVVIVGCHNAFEDTMVDT